MRPALRVVKAPKKKPKAKIKKTVFAKVQNVNRIAYKFTPEVLVTVGVDPKHGRTMVKEIKVGKGVSQISMNYFMMALDRAAKILCTEERTARALYVSNCSHPGYRVKKKLYEVSDGWESAWFCTRCGARLERKP